MFSLDPIITDTLAVCTHELGAASALELVAAAAIETAVETAPLAGSARGPAAERLIAEQAAVNLWTTLWYRLADERPQSFLVHPDRLSSSVSPAALAYLYARKNSKGLTPFKPTAAESTLLVAARSFLHQATGLARLAGPGQLFSSSASCGPLRSLPGFDGLVGWSFANEPAISEQALVDGEYIARQRLSRKGSAEVAALVLHEEIHSAFAAVVSTKPAALSEPLLYSLNEGVTALLEVAAIETALRGKTPSPDELRNAIAGHFYQRQGEALLGLLGEGETSAIMTAAAAAGRAALRSGSAAGTVKALNRLSGRSLSAASWLELFGRL